MTLLTRTRRDSQRWPEETQAHFIFFEENFLFLNFFFYEKLGLEGSRNICFIKNRLFQQIHFLDNKESSWNFIKF